VENELARRDRSRKDDRVPRDSPRDELEAFLLREFPGAVPLSRYQPFDMRAIVSFDPDRDLAVSGDEVLEVVAERVAQVYELVFAPEARGWLCAVQHGALQSVLPEHLTIEDVTSDGRVDIGAFVPQPVRRPDPDDLSVLIDTLPPQARERVEIGHGHDPLEDPEFAGLCDEEGVPYVDLVVRVRPRDVDYRSLIRAVVNQDFPMEGRTRLIATLFVVNEDRPALLDLPDDRWFGVAMPDAEALRAVYECGVAPLNEYRRPQMEQIFGSWPEP
jgi:hypothetical protein